MSDLRYSPGDPATRVACVEAQARRAETPCGEGALAWRRWGAGPAMVLLHGGTGSWTHWISNVEALSAARTVWVPDMPGFGDSASPPKGSDVSAIAGILARGLTQLLKSGQRVELVGFSFGGLVAGHLAAAHPELVARLVLVGAGGLGLRGGKKLPLVAWRHLKDEASRRAAHRHNLANLMLWSEARIDDLALYIQSSNAKRSRINSGPFSRGDVLLTPLSKVKAPVAGIWGFHDSTAIPRLAEVEPILRLTDPTAIVEVVEGAGHWVMYEQPGKVNELLLRGAS